MNEFITALDTKIFLFFNSLHHPATDVFMYTFSERFVWVPLYVITFLMVMRYYGWKAGLMLFIATIAAVALSDQLCATFIRPAVARLRPANLGNPISDLVHIVDGYRGGSYGFPSCHAANSFAFATIMMLTMPTRRLTAALLLWATVNCYSRIYLGVHYPGDLFVGAIIGSCVGFACYLAFRYTMRALSADGKRTTHITLSFIAPRYVDRANFHIADIMIATILLTAAAIAVYSVL